MPADKTLPLKYWTGVVELPPGPNGERRRKPIRRKNKAELLKELAKLRVDLEKRGDIPTANTTVEKWFSYWLDNIAAKKVRPNTLDGYRRTVNNHIVPAIGKIKLDKVTAAHVRRVHDAILEKGNNSTTALLAHRTMSVSFKAALREGRIGRNPATLTDAPKKAATTLHALDLGEAIQLLAHLATRPDGALWATVLLTGARRGEVIGLERDRVSEVLDLSWQLIRIKKTGTEGKPDVPADFEYRHVSGGLYLTRPKSRSGWRVIPLIDPLRSILAHHIEQTPPNEWGLLFTRNGRPYSPDLAGKDWRKVLLDAGIEKDVRLHDGRHTTVDLLYAAGVPDDLIQEIVGHSTRSMTQAYKSLRNRERLTSAMQQFSELLAANSPSAIDPPTRG
ncbi:site-specific integrase [Microbacterium sp. NPDC078814]|uniref:tyrosine-type recombinase/integrase n=1 Tax=Microbacterium sp. NPDC078814 TaxID=3154767 RepID=UPI00344FB20D